VQGPHFSHWFSSSRDDVIRGEKGCKGQALLRVACTYLTFVTCFNADDVAAYRIVGTKGQLQVNPAYEYAGAVSPMN
jgi:hypothetical protein